MRWIDRETQLPKTLNGKSILFKKDGENIAYSGCVTLWCQPIVFHRQDDGAAIRFLGKDEWTHWTHCPENLKDARDIIKL